MAERPEPATVIIPARGGSKGVPRKNLRTVGGVPLVVRSVRAARELTTGPQPRVERVVVSTDDPEVAALARREGAHVEDRSLAAAHDQATVDDVVAEVVDRLWVHGPLGPLAVLQPTSPFTDARLVAAVLDALGEYDSVATVRPVHAPLWGRRGPLVDYLGVNRQWAKPGAWVETGAVRATRAYPNVGTTHRLIGQSHLLFDPDDEMALTGDMAARYALDIDTPEDFALARHLARHGRPVLFVVTAGPTTGSGHVHRALTLADELAHHYVEFAFLGESATWAAELIEGRGYPVTDIADRLDPALGTGPPRLVVFDCLEFVDAQAVHNAKALDAAVAVFENLDPGVVELADLAVNALYAGPPPALCGPRWEPLRAEFTVAARPSLADGAASDRPKVLVTFGGTDPSRLTERFVEELAPLADLAVLWPPGRADKGPPPLPTGVAVHGGAVSQAMSWADIVVTAGGRTVLEAAAMHRAVVSVAATEREVGHAPLPGVFWLGHHATVPPGRVADVVRWLGDNPAERLARAGASYAAVDAARAATALAGMLDTLIGG